MPYNWWEYAEGEPEERPTLKPGRRPARPRRLPSWAPAAQGPAPAVPLGPAIPAPAAGAGTVGIGLEQVAPTPALPGAPAGAGEGGAAPARIRGRAGVGLEVRPLEGTWWEAAGRLALNPRAIPPEEIPEPPFPEAVTAWLNRYNPWGIPGTPKWTGEPPTRGQILEAGLRGPLVTADLAWTALNLPFEEVGRPLAGTLAAFWASPEGKAALANVAARAGTGTVPSPVGPGPAWWRPEQFPEAPRELRFNIQEQGLPGWAREWSRQAKEIEERRPELFPLEKMITEGILLDPLTWVGAGAPRLLGRADELAKAAKAAEEAGELGRAARLWQAADWLRQLGTGGRLVSESADVMGQAMLLPVKAAAKGAGRGLRWLGSRAGEALQAYGEAYLRSPAREAGEVQIPDWLAKLVRRAEALEQEAARAEEQARRLEAAGAETAEAARARARAEQLAGEAARLREQGDVALRQLRAQEAEGAEAAGQRPLERSLERSLSGQTQSLSGTPSLRSSSGEAAGLTKQSRTSPPLTQPEGVQSSDQTHLPSVMQRTTPPPSSVGPTHTLGSMDPTSNRVVVQPHGDVDALLRGAAEQEGWLREHLSQAVEGVPGARLAGVRTKELAEVQRKLRGKPAHTIPDYLGGRVVIDDLSVADDIIPRLGRVVKDDVFYEAPKLGYRARHVQIELPNGMTAEVQFVPREIAEVQEVAHKAYEVLRSPRATEEERAAAETRSEELFNEAWDRFLRRTGRKAAEAAPTPERLAQEVAAYEAAQGRHLGDVERHFAQEVAEIRASYDRAVARGDIEEAERARGFIEEALKELASERAMNEELVRWTGVQPDRATEETWRRADEAIQQRLYELQQRMYAFGKEIEGTRGRFGRREAERRARQYWREALEDVAERYGKLLEEAGYTAEEIAPLNYEQRRRLLEEVGNGRLTRTAAGRPASIGGIDPLRRGEVLARVPEGTAARAREAAQSLLDAPGLEAGRLYRVSEMIRAWHLGEDLRPERMDPYPDDVARWLPERPLRTLEGEAAEGAQAGMPGVAQAPKAGAPAGAERAPMPEGWLRPVASNEEILDRAYRGGRLAQWLREQGRKHPVLQWVTSRAGMPADDPQVKAFILRETIISDGNAQVTAAMARLRQLGSARKLFEVDENEMAHLPGRSPVALYDLLENPKGYKLTPRQREYIDTLWRAYDEMRALLEAEGIEVPKRQYPEGAHYVGRRVLGRLDPESGTFEVGVIGRGPGAGGRVSPLGQVDEEDVYGPLIGRRGEFELARVFGSHEEALRQGFRYLEPEEVLQLNLQYVFRRIADERMSRYVLENIPHRVLPQWTDVVGVRQTGSLRPGEVTLVQQEVVRRTGRTRFGEAQVLGPRLQGVAFQARDIARLRELLGQVRAGWWEKGAEFLAGANAIPRMLMTTVDFGAAFVQLQGVMLSRPKQWARAVVEGARAFASEETFQRYLAQNADEIAEAGRYGLDLTPSEFTEGAGVLRRVLLERGTVEEAGRSAANKKLRRAAAMAEGLWRAWTSPFTRMYEAQLTAAKIELWKALKPLAKSEDDLADLAKHVNLMTGSLNVRRLGLSPRQRAAEGAVLFASRYYRSVLALMADVARGGLRGRLARESFGRAAVAGLLGYVGLCEALGQDPILDPRDSRFMTVEIAGQRIGLGGSWFTTQRMLLRMTVGTALELADLARGRSRKTAAEIALSPAEEAARWLSQRLSPVLSAVAIKLPSAMQLIAVRKFIGDPVDTRLVLRKELLGQHLLPIWLMSVIESGGRPEERIALGVAEIAGLRTFPVSAREKRDALREELARERFGRPWGELSRPQQYELVEGSPELAQATLLARQQSADRGSVVAQFWLDVEKERERYRAEIAALGEDLRAGRISGNEYRQEVARREQLMAAVPRILKAARPYQDVPLTAAERQAAYGPGGEGEPTTPVDRYLEMYYQAAAVATDPRTGRTDFDEMMRLRDLLDEVTPRQVVREARRYLDRNKDPEYARALEQYREYQRIPTYLGLTAEQGAAADKALAKIQDLAATVPGMTWETAWAVYAQRDPRGALLARVARSRRNPLRRAYWATHPLLARFFSDLTWDELEYGRSLAVPMGAQAGGA